MKINTAYRRRKKSEHGGTTFEAIMAIVILFFMVFAMLQIYHWCMAKQVCLYSAFYTNKWTSLGYRNEYSLRAARVAAIPISGPSVGSGDDNELAAEHYMMGGNASGVYYEYWHPRTIVNQSPTLSVYGRRYTPPATNVPTTETIVILENAPLLHKNLANMLFIKKAPEPGATVQGYNYSEEYLEE